MRKSQVVRIAWSPAANQTRLFRDQFNVAPVAKPTWFRQWQRTFFDIPGLRLVRRLFGFECSPAEFGALSDRLETAAEWTGESSKLGRKGVLHLLGIDFVKFALLGQTPVRPNSGLVTRA